MEYVIRLSITGIQGPIVHRMVSPLKSIVKDFIRLKVAITPSWLMFLQKKDGRSLYAQLANIFAEKRCEKFCEQAPHCFSAKVAVFLGTMLLKTIS